MVHSHQPMNIRIFTQPGSSFGLENKVVESTAKEILSNEDFEVNVKNSDISKSLTNNGISYQNHEILQETQTGLHLLLAEIPSGNGNASFNFEYKDEHSAVTKEIKQELVEWDVEKVIAEQETHDLFCPNCKSCITKRVILTKRKRSVQNVQYGVKREKTEPVSGLDTNLNATETDDRSLDVTHNEVGTNDRDLDTGPDVFRCLSCFSFFIPTVAGFRIFGGKDKGEKLLSPEQTPDANIRAPEQDVKNSSISSLATTFLLLRKPHANRQVEVSIGGNMKDEKNVVVNSIQGIPPLLGNQTDEKDKHDSPVKKVDKGGDLIIIVEEEAVGARASHSVHDSIVPAAPDIFPVSVTGLYDNQPRVDESRSSEWDILKSIVYGGLVEVITSLGVVSSAAGGNATTMNIMALTLANLVSGFIILVHGIRELKYEQYGVITDRDEDKGDRYLEVLGWRKNYWRHAIVAVLSYLVFGLLPPLVYGFSFYKSDNKEYKMISVAAVSLIGIMLLATGKAHVQKSPRAYSKTILYYLSIGVTASGLSFLAGELIIKFLNKVDWFEPSGVAPVPPSSFIETISGKPAGWAYY